MGVKNVCEKHMRKTCGVEGTSHQSEILHSLIFCLFAVSYWRHVVSDYTDNKLYWTDSKLNRIESCSLDGSSRTVLMEGLAQPYSLVVYEGDIYWTEWDTLSVKKASLSSPDVIEVVTTQVSNKPTSVLVSFLQRPTSSKGCVPFKISPRKGTVKLIFLTILQNKKTFRKIWAVEGISRFIADSYSLHRLIPHN